MSRCYLWFACLLRSRIACLTIRRNTNPVRGWEDCSPFRAASRTNLWNSPIGASFDTKRLTPALTSSRMASCLNGVAFFPFGTRMRDPFFPDLAFMVRALR